MRTLGFLTSMGLAPAVKPAEPSSLPTSATLAERFHNLRGDMAARFPGCEVTVFAHYRPDATTYECEIKGKRPDGTTVTFSAQSRDAKWAPNPNALEHLLKETDSWT